MIYLFLSLVGLLFGVVYGAGLWDKSEYRKIVRLVEVYNPEYWESIGKPGPLSFGLPSQGLKKSMPSYKFYASLLNPLPEEIMDIPGIQAAHKKFRKIKKYSAPLMVFLFLAMVTVGIVGLVFDRF